MDKIRVLHILETIGSGGVERRRLSLAKKLDKNKFELKIICTAIKGPLAGKISEEGVEVIPIGQLTSPFQTERHRQVQKIISEFKPHILHGAVFEGVTLAAINGFFKKTPLVIIEETSDPVTRRWKANLLMRLFGMLTDVSIGVSPAAVDYLIKTAKIPQQKVKLITNGVATPRFVSEEEKNNLKIELGIGEGDLVIGSVGRMLQNEHKRFSDLIKAFAALSSQDTNLNLKLLLVGEGPEKEKYEYLAKELNIKDKVIFTGFQEDTAKYYAIMNIFSLVSAYEAFGLVLAEAMLHQLPIVATNVGGMKHIIKNNETGFLVERFKTNEIASKLAELTRDADLRKRFGNAGKKRAMENYTEELYVANVQKLYLELASEKRLF